ncbi:TlpA disulfide reductase family protein [Bacillus massilinigeriensis]|uniref:TlpA disulfide reductase family protein n=1 Tax=Bacillus mediterraneensis TaxID=1805474 RepID=UPI0008F9452E|nr:TlpA disulfide reductase family protein [Bacillus mediterraneensis]
MKKFILIVGILLAVLFIVDKTMLKEEGMIKRAGEAGKYEEIKDIKSIIEGLEKGNKAPDFQLTDLDGKTVALSDYKGKKVLLNFWASWCKPCRAEMPEMEEMFKDQKENGYVILAVNMAHSEKKLQHVEAFVKEYGLTFTVPLDKEGEVSSMYEIMAYPTTYFIDSKGVIRSKSIGGMNRSFMEREMKKLP